jgi:hypothetical protein
MDENFLPLMKFTNASVVWVRCCDGCPFGTVVNMDGKFEVKKTPQKMEEAELPASNNKSSFQFPDYVEADGKFREWSRNNNTDDDTTSYKNMHHFYDIIVGNKKR